MIQLILHLLGDYVFQSHWMANNKTKCGKAAAAHAVVYSLPFLLLQPSLVAFAVILITHFLIDRFRLARYLVYAKNVLFQPRPRMRPFDEYAAYIEQKGTTPELAARLEHKIKWSWPNCSATGFPSDTPPFLAVWLLIATDNTIHLAINYAALRYL